MAGEPAHQSADILATYEEMFKHRYTDRDPDYVKTSQAPAAPPPCVENWFSRPKRSFNWTQRPDNRNRDDSRHGNRDQRGYNDHRDHNREHHQSRDRRHGDHDDRGDHSGEHRNKYYRGEDRGRGNRH